MSLTKTAGCIRERVGSMVLGMGIRIGVPEELGICSDGAAIVLEPEMGGDSTGGFCGV